MKAVLRLYRVVFVDILSSDFFRRYWNVEKAPKTTPKAKNINNRAIRLNLKRLKKRKLTSISKLF